MTPNRPYLLRALFDWICDNNCTPYLLVDATLEGVEVPQEHVSGGRIVLNASGTAVANFDISNDAVTFSTRFSGRDTWISVPMPAVLAIYAKETQDGMTFAPADYPDRKQRAEYLVEADDEAADDENKLKADSPASSQVASPQESSPPATSRDGDGSKEPSKKQAKTSGKDKKRSGSHLKVVK